MKLTESIMNKLNESDINWSKVNDTLDKLAVEKGYEDDDDLLFNLCSDLKIDFYKSTMSYNKSNNVQVDISTNYYKGIEKDVINWLKEKNIDWYKLSGINRTDDNYSMIYLDTEMPIENFKEI